ncbi:MAG: S8 family serine peptidase [Woeseiaceae bacterium]|nr:S8 family serine peptidase [Woeseiaceae bacterium]
MSWRTIVPCLVVGLALGVVDLRVAAADDAEPPGVSEWIVVMTDTRSSRRKGWSSGVGYSGSYNYANDPKLRRLATTLASDYKLEVEDQWPVRALNVHCVVVRIEDNVQATVAALEGDRRVEWVQPLHEFEGLAAALGNPAPEAEPYRHLQSSLDMMNIAALGDGLSGAGVQIAVVDSGVERDHPDIQHALAEHHDFVGTGSSSERHGTGIAGVLVAHNRNGVGISGVAPGAQLHAYRACWESDDGKTRCNSLTLSLALDQVVDDSPHIVNLSLTGPRDRLLDKLVDRILENGSIIVVAHDGKAPAGNRFPSPRPGIVTVRDGSKTARTERGVFAPGDAVLTAQPGHSYDYMTGTSLSAAHVSGVVALMLEANPDVDVVAASAMLVDSIRSSGDGASIDACAAVNSAAGSARCR